MSTYKTFMNLHRADEPLLLANIWDVNSAMIMEEGGFKALGTSSAAVAHTLGYQDGEQMSFEELLFVVKRIARKTELPLSVDIEGGFDRDPGKIAEHIEALYRLGVVGVNLEDSIVQGQREILPVKDFAKVIKTVSGHLQNRKIDMFLNIRTDTYLLPVKDPLEETLARIPVYEENGANGIFVPCMVSKNDISAITKSTSLPVNVMCMPGLPGFDTLKELGVKRISMGNVVHHQLTKYLKSSCQTIQQQQSFASLYSKT